jgi:hypothetical protein
MPPKKGLLAIIAGKPENDNAEGDETEEEVSPLRRALQDLAEAMSSKDWDSAETAFRDAKAASDADYEEDESMEG